MKGSKTSIKIDDNTRLDIVVEEDVLYGWGPEYTYYILVMSKKKFIFWDYWSIDSSKHKEYNIPYNNFYGVYTDTMWEHINGILEESEINCNLSDMKKKFQRKNKLSKFL